MTTVQQLTDAYLKDMGASRPYDSVDPVDVRNAAAIAVFEMRYWHELGTRGTSADRARARKNFKDQVKKYPALAKALGYTVKNA